MSVKVSENCSPKPSQATVGEEEVNMPIKMMEDRVKEVFEKNLNPLLQDKTLQKIYEGVKGDFFKQTYLAFACAKDEINTAQRRLENADLTSPDTKDLEDDLSSKIIAYMDAELKRSQVTQRILSDLKDPEATFKKSLEGLSIFERAAANTVYWFVQSRIPELKNAAEQIIKELEKICF